MPSLQVFAGARARRRLLESGLRAADVVAVPAAAGGPASLVFNPLDRFLFGDWLAREPHVVHLLGASIGAWRMAAACRPDADAALARMAEAYITQRYPHRPGKSPAPQEVSALLGVTLHAQFGAQPELVLGHPTRRLHVFTSRGRWRSPLGLITGFPTNALHRRALGTCVQRVVFGDPRTPLPLPLNDLSTVRVGLNAANLTSALLASCSIPFWLGAVHDIAGAPPGAYWDGGITDFHLHLDYAALGDGLVLYPHFQPTVIPGWFDSTLRRRHRATAHLDNVVLLTPHPDWVRTLPDARLPDRQDFRTYLDDVPTRVRRWRRALAESARLVDEFAALVRRPSIDALALV